ncbi:MAG: cupin-like domain-containing protein [Deltaproteobacteria bacterium]|nr:cupin-like domain-containing protein [Deltaproteobacteria bacterium]
MPSPETVPRIRAHRLDRVLPRRRPVVVEGLLDGQPQLTLHELAEHWGDRRLPVAPLEDGVIVFDATAGVPFRERPLIDVIDNLEERDAGVVSVRPSDWLPGITARLPSFDPIGASWRRSRLWVSPRGAITPLHHEVTQNLLAQLEGDKEVTLYAPWTRPAMYPHRPWSGMPHTSRVAAHAPDARRYPLFSRARPHRALLNPGDVLFIPAGWWHWVRALAPSLSHNTWFADGAVALLARSLERYKELRSLQL